MSAGSQFGSFDGIESLPLLAAVLARNTETYETGSRQDRRDAIANCLQSVASYLASNGIDPRHLQPLLHPVEALYERENNRLDPIFCERIRQGTPSRSLIQDQQDGIIAAIANHWLAHNADKTAPMKNRLTAAARLMRNSGLGELQAARVKQARELVSREAPKHPARLMADVVDSWLQKASTEVGANHAVSQILPLVLQFSAFAFAQPETE